MNADEPVIALLSSAVTAGLVCYFPSDLWVAYIIAAVIAVTVIDTRRREKEAMRREEEEAERWGWNDPPQGA